MREPTPGERLRWDAIADRCPDATAGAELGVLYGTLSAELLRILPQLTLYMVDRWDAYPEDKRLKRARVTRQPASWFYEALDRARKAVAPFGERAQIVQGDTVAMASHVPDGLDFVFVDADHTYDGVIADVRAWEVKVKPGGWMFGHDYGSKRHPDVKRAVDDMYGTRVEVDADYVWAVQL